MLAAILVEGSPTLIAKGTGQMTNLPSDLGSKAPIMLWLNRRHQQLPSKIQKRCEVLVAESIEDCVETLARQPVDVLLVDETILQSNETDLINEITRCWPYLLCMILVGESDSASVADNQKTSLPILINSEDQDSVLDQLYGKLYGGNGLTSIH